MPRELTWSEGSRLVHEMGSENYLAARITQERERRGWSQSELARRLQATGANVHQTAISKIEKAATERRAISVDEAIAFAKVFQIPLDELLLPPAAVSNLDFSRAVDAGREYLRELEKATRKYEAHVRAMANAANTDETWASLLDGEWEWIAKHSPDRPSDDADMGWSVPRLLRDVRQLRSETAVRRRGAKRRAE